MLFHCEVSVGEGEDAPLTIWSIEFSQELTDTLLSKVYRNLGEVIARVEQREITQYEPDSP